MPTYPGSPQLTVDALLRTPVLMARALTALTSARLAVADRLFARGTPDQVAGGLVWFQRTESIYPTRGTEEVGVLSDWPRSGWTEAILTAIVRKYGLEIPISFESIRRNDLDQIARAQRKLANSITKFVDTQAVSLLSSDAAVLTGAAAAGWTVGATTIVTDIATARKTIQDQDQGYVADSLIVHPAQELILLTNANLLSLLPRENMNPAYMQTLLSQGRPVPILGLQQILVSPQLTSGTAYIANARVCGTIADEMPDPIEGYVSYDPNIQGGAAVAMRGGPGGNLGVQPSDQFNPNSNEFPVNQYPADFPPVYVKVYTVDGVDGKIVRGARFPAMWLSEPTSVYKLTGC